MVRLKVSIPLYTMADFNVFQFQYGAIEGKIVAQGDRINLYFNSSMVRLKETARTIAGVSFEFQFQYGAIEGR